MSYLFCSRRLQRDNIGQTMTQLSASLLFLDVFSLIGYNRFQLDSQIACIITAALTHYFLLSALIWVAILGHVILKMVSAEYVIQERMFLCQRMPIAWGKA